MTRPGFYLERRERFTRDGALIVTHNHIALLNGLLDRPDGIAHSCKDLVRAGFPYLALFRNSRSFSSFAKAAARLNTLWVDRIAVGSRVECHLTERGRAILDGAVRSRVIGYGDYLGLKALRRRA